MKFIIPKLNIYGRLSRLQENLWNTYMKRPFGDHFYSDEYRFCHDVYGMKSDKIHIMDHQIDSIPVEKGSNIQKMTACCVWNASNAAATATPNLDTTVTVGSRSYDVDGDTSGPTTTAFVYGYKAVSSYHPLLAFSNIVGSIANGTYTDGGSTSQTVTSINWSDNGIPGTPAAETDNIYFGLNGTSRGDDNGTFLELEYNGVTYTRVSRDAYIPSQGGGETFWRWDNVATNGPTSGTVDFLIFCS